MILAFGDIWNLAEDLDLIVVPTNEGFRQDGAAVMGRGLSWKANDRDTTLASWYGQQIRKSIMEKGKTPGVIARGLFVLFPTKPLNRKAPWLSWQQPANLKTIRKSAKQLAKRITPIKGYRILVPLVGCGTGGLKERDVRPILEEYLTKPHFVLVKRK